MNQFDYKKTVVPEFHFNVLPDQELREEISVSFSIGISKDLAKDKRVRCDALVEVCNLDTKNTDIKFTAISFFDITSSEIDINALIDDAKEYCIPISIQKADEKLSQMSKFLIGQELNFQLPQQIPPI